MMGNWKGEGLQPVHTQAVAFLIALTKYQTNQRKKGLQFEGTVCHGGDRLGGQQEGTVRHGEDRRGGQQEPETATSHLESGNR